MQERVTRAGLAVAAEVARFVEARLLPGLPLDAAAFWQGFAAILARFTPENRALLAARQRMQDRIDAWHRDMRGRDHDPAAYRALLEQIGYLLPPGPDFTIGTTGLDPEIATIPGPQLVVPVMNARFALNAANARWGSLYDALYGTDALGTPPPPGPFRPKRGARVVAWGRGFLDRTFPLAGAGWAEVTGLAIAEGRLIARTAAGGRGLADPARFGGHDGPAGAPTGVILDHHGLAVELVIDRTRGIGATDPAGIADIRIESALTAIMDCEDSVAAVDAADKVLAWGNWLGLMQGTLTEEVTKGGTTFTRTLAPDRTVTAPDGSTRRIPGRAILWVRNVGHLMTTPAILGPDGQEAPEGLCDAVMTIAAACHDRGTNSRTGAIYVVKPKMHGPAEVAFADRVFAAVEDLLGLARNTVKLGLMDEERRTSVNLKSCIRAARDRIAFVNTGFLDRTGDEIHTAMQAGPLLPKAEMKTAAWLRAYERQNVEIALAAGFAGRAQIGKGMWASPDRMGAMLAAKVAHPEQGASTAWVPSPTAATLHALHYHMVDVRARQAAIAADPAPDRRDDLLTLPLLGGRNLSGDEIARDLDNNAQGILGYVVRWVDQGIGCSKVPDLSGEALMEDRATCRISAQAIANWLAHGLVTPDQVTAAFRRMAAVVDGQNRGDPAYRPMAPDCDGPAFRAALALARDGAVQPSGYTEPILHHARLAARSSR
jgi:malate synthase